MLPAEATADLSCVTSQQLFCLVSLVGTVVIASHTLYTRRQVKSVANTFQSIDTSNLKRSLTPESRDCQDSMGDPKANRRKERYTEAFILWSHHNQESASSFAVCWSLRFDEYTQKARAPQRPQWWCRCLRVASAAPHFLTQCPYLQAVGRERSVCFIPLVRRQRPVVGEGADAWTGRNVLCLLGLIGRNNQDSEICLMVLEIREWTCVEKMLAL